MSRRQLIRNLLVVALVTTASVSSAAPPGQSAPVNVTPPSISGTAREGETLTADKGAWTGPSAEFAFQWQRCNTSGAACAPISDAAASKYGLGGGDVGSTLRVTVLASNKNGSAVATSNPTGTVTSPSAPPPVAPPPPTPGVACADGADNDNDGKTDFPADPGCTSTADVDEVDPAVDPVEPVEPGTQPSEWVKVADENGTFTLSENKEVRYGKDATWTSKVLGPGTYSCSNGFFGDPLVGTVKVCEARATTEQLSTSSTTTSTWVQVASENQSFTLSENKEVRYGRDSTWTTRILGPGTYSCSNGFFGDPLVGVAKVCEARATTLQPPLTTDAWESGDLDPSASTSGDVFFNGDFDTGNLSQWRDFHDAHLSRTPPGFQVVSSPRFGSSGYAARVNVVDSPDTSVGGDLSMLWDGDGNNSYQLPYLQRGRTTWFRMQFALPDGTNPSFPGKFTVRPGSWAMIYEWHTNPYVVPTAYSTYLGVHTGGGTSSDPATLIMRPVGGTGEGTHTYLYQTNGSAQTQANRIPIKFNHWYDIVIRITFGTTASSGSVEWYVDGVKQTSCSCPTIAVAADGSVPGVGHEVGFYRGPSQSYQDTIYIDGIRAAGTRAAVEG